MAGSTLVLVPGRHRQPTPRPDHDPGQRRTERRGQRHRARAAAARAHHCACRADRILRDRRRRSRSWAGFRRTAHPRRIRRSCPSRSRARNDGRAAGGQRQRRYRGRRDDSGCHRTARHRDGHRARGAAAQLAHDHAQRQRLRRIGDLLGPERNRRGDGARRRAAAPSPGGRCGSTCSRVPTASRRRSPATGRHHADGHLRCDRQGQRPHQGQRQRADPVCAASGHRPHVGPAAHRQFPDPAGHQRLHDPHGRARTATITGAFKANARPASRVDYFIYGGTPPYRVTSTFPDAVTIVNPTVNESGGFFEAITNGACVNPLTFTIVDATGRQTTATLINVRARAEAADNARGARHHPDRPSHTALTCTGKTFPFVITGGTPPFNVAAAGGAPSSPVSRNVAGQTSISSDLSTAVGAHDVLVGDSSKPQLTTTATITCNS